MRTPRNKKNNYSKKLIEQTEASARIINVFENHGFEIDSIEQFQQIVADLFSVLGGKKVGGAKRGPKPGSKRGPGRPAGTGKKGPGRPAKSSRGPGRPVGSGKRGPGRPAKGPGRPAKLKRGPKGKRKSAVKIETTPNTEA